MTRFSMKYITPLAWLETAAPRPGSQASHISLRFFVNMASSWKVMVPYARVVNEDGRDRD